MDGLPDGRLVELAADHDLPLDEPDAIAEAVRQTFSASSRAAGMACLLDATWVA
jgi:hypothetical protein